MKQHPFKPVKGFALITEDGVILNVSVRPINFKNMTSAAIHHIDVLLSPLPPKQKPASRKKVGKKSTKK